MSKMKGVIPAVGEPENSVAPTDLANPHARSDLDMTPAVVELGHYFGVDVSAPPDIQVLHGKQASADGLRAKIRLGLHVLSIKAQVKHGEFLPYLAEMDVSERQAQQAAQIVRVFAQAGDARRTEIMLQMGAAKAIRYAAAAPQVQQLITEDPELQQEVREASVRQFERRIKELTDQNDLLRKKVEVSKLEADAKAKTDRVLIPNMPNGISDVRREVAALYEKARLSVLDMADLRSALLDAATEAGGESWIDQTAHQVLISMRSLQAQLAGQITAWAEYFKLPIDGDLPGAADRAYFRPEEIDVIQTHFQTLLATHADERAKRSNRAHNERSRGRPRANV